MLFNYILDHLQSAEEPIYFMHTTVCISNHFRGIFQGIQNLQSVCMLAVCERDIRRKMEAKPFIFIYLKSSFVIWHKKILGIKVSCQFWSLNFFDLVFSHWFRDAFFIKNNVFDSLRTIYFSLTFAVCATILRSHA